MPLRPEPAKSTLRAAAPDAPPQRRGQPESHEAQRRGLRRVTWLWAPLLLVSGAGLVLAGEPGSELRGAGWAVLAFGGILVAAMMRASGLVARSTDEQRTLDAGESPAQAWAEWSLPPRVGWLWVRHARATARRWTWPNLLRFAALPVAAALGLWFGEAGPLWTLVGTGLSVVALAGVVAWAGRWQQRELDRLQRARPRVVFTEHALHLGDESVPWYFGRGIPPLGRGHVRRCELVEDATPPLIRIRLHDPMSRGETRRDVEIPAPVDPRYASEVVHELRRRIDG